MLILREMCYGIMPETFIVYSSNKTNISQKFLHQVLWHSLAKLSTKNYENPSIFVKVTAKKSVAPFYVDTVYKWFSTAKSARYAFARKNAF